MTDNNVVADVEAYFKLNALCDVFHREALMPHITALRAEVESLTAERDELKRKLEISEKFRIGNPCPIYTHKGCKENDDLRQQLAAKTANLTACHEQLTTAKAEIAVVRSDLESEVNAFGILSDKCATANATIERLTAERHRDALDGQAALEERDVTIEGLKGVIKIVQIGDLPMPVFDADLPLGGKTETLEGAYQMGYECGLLECGEAVSKALSDTPASPWTTIIPGDVSTLPEKSGQVWIAYEKTGYTYVAYYDVDYKKWAIFDPCGGYSDIDTNSPPTHWQKIRRPIPEKGLEDE